MVVSIVLLALLALLLTDVLSSVLRRLALRKCLTDRPVEGRKAHERPTPYLGGVAIVAGTLVPLLLVSGHWDGRLGVLVLAGTAVAVLGLVDDLRPLSPLTRLAVECLAASGVVAAGGGLGVLDERLDPVVTVLWIVVITNSFNLLDNMDGAAATVASVTAGSLAVAAYLFGRTGCALLLLALAAACAGFLVHNWPPARMFMGDAGSLFIGFVIAGSTVLVEAPEGAPARIAEVLLVTFVATVDTCLVLISRRRVGRGLFTGGTDHVTHRLRRLGLSVPQVALTLCAASMAACLSGVLVAHQRLPGAVMLAGAAAVAVALVWWLLKVPVYGAAPAPAGVTAPAGAALATGAALSAGAALATADRPLIGKGAAPPVPGAPLTAEQPIGDVT
ncbi:MraY family glycosyltransferase [Actinomadura viridis]|uniref:MraY family glycosyltransferase n=1 Tax=Actinomadura viridis TaxID=58110 RepID=UPI0036A8DA1F